MINWSRPAMTVAALAAVSGMLAACSSSDSSSEPAATATATAAETAAETAGGVGDFGEDGGYAYATNVDDHRLLVVDVCEVKAALDAEGGPQYADINSVYTDGANSVKGDGSVRTLKGFASAEGKKHNSDEYYGSAGSIDAFVTSAIDGSGDFDGESDGTRSQAIEKGIQNETLVAYVAHELFTALAKGADGDFAGGVHNWDEGWAFYHGAEPGCSPYATGNSRAENYATLSDDGVTALANVNILNAMIEGRDALLNEDVDTATTAANEVIRNLVTIYSQAVIRYATKMTSDLAEGDQEAARAHQAEGLAFWRVIEPYVGGINPDSTSAINGVFALSSDPASGTEGDVRAALEPIWDATGVSADEVGTLQ